MGLFGPRTPKKHQPPQKKSPPRHHAPSLNLPPPVSNSLRHSPLSKTTSAPVPFPYPQSNSYNSYTESLSIPTAPEPHEEQFDVLCRICEEFIHISQLEEHSRLCSVVSRAGLHISSCDDRLNKLISAINRRVAKHRTLSFSKSLSSGSDDVSFSETLCDDEVSLLEQLSAIASTARNTNDEYHDAQEINTIKQVLMEKLSVIRESTLKLPTCTDFDFEIVEFDSKPKEDRPHKSVVYYISHIERLIAEKMEAAESSTGFAPALLSPIPRKEMLSPLTRFGSSTSSRIELLGNLREEGSFRSKSRPSSAGSTSSPAAKNVPIISDFELLKPISRGAFGRVFLARKKRTGDLYAMKVLKKDDMIRKNQVSRVQNERNILSITDCPFLIKCYWTFQSQRHLYMVMEYVSGGDLDSLLNNVGRLPEHVARRYIAEVVISLDYLHSHGIIHRDVKPDNLLVTNDGHIKLIDFGLSHIGIKSNPSIASSDYDSPTSDPDTDIESRSFLVDDYCPSPNPYSKSSPDVERRYSCVGTPEYCAPELFTGKGHDRMVDWWSLGVLTFELITGSVPFAGDDPNELTREILARNILWPEDIEFSTEAKNFVDNLLVLEPNKRLGHGSISEIKNHPFLAGINWETILTTPGPFIPSLSNESDTSYFISRSPELPNPGSPNSPRFDAATIMQDLPLSPTHDDPVFSNFSYKNVSQLQRKNMYLSHEFRRRSSVVHDDDELSQIAFATS
ncbi:hypothetical protein RCL1_001719 [Eukaryota sp. TZLM3-RCL]